MKKTGNTEILIALLTFLIFISAGRAVANDIEATLRITESQVIMGEQIQIIIEVKSNRSVNVTRPAPPDLNGFRYRSTMPSTSTSYSIINGVTTITYGYTFTAVAQEEGNFIIPSFRIRVEGDWYETNSASVTIHSREDRRSDAISRLPEIYLELELSEEKPFTGQQIIADVVLYFRDNIQINSFQVTRGWSTEGFWQEDLSGNHSTRAETIFLDGVRYRRAVLTRHAIFPTRQGELTLTPYNIRASIRTSAGNYDTQGSLFAQGFGRSRNIDLETKETKINVNSLPRPQRGQFINAIGELQIRRSLSDTRIMIGESVEVITEIKGRGNLNLINRPQYKMPEDFDVFRPQETIEQVKTGTHIEGTKTFRDVMIARKVSTFSIPAETIAFYDDRAGRYRYVELPELTFQVVRDPNERVGFVSSSDVRLHPVTGLANWTSASARFSYYRWWFWAGLLVPALALMVAFFYTSYQQKLRTDSNFARYKNARQEAMVYLHNATASVNSGQLKQAYGYIHHSLYGYISDRLGLAKAGMSDKEIVAYLRQKGIDQATVDGCYRVLDKCSGIRFAPVESSDDAHADIETMKKLIQHIQKETA